MAGVKAASVFEVFSHEGSPRGNTLSQLHSNFPRLRGGLCSGHHVRMPPHTPAALNNINLLTKTIKVSFRRWLYLTHTSWLINWDYITVRRPHFTRRQTTRQMIYDIYSTTCCIIQAVSLMSSFPKKLSWAKNICESISIFVSNPAFFVKLFTLPFKCGPNYTLVWFLNWPACFKDLTLALSSEVNK